jgi:hypothetical protein
MDQSVFVKLQFWLLVLFSLVLPFVLVWVCLTVRAVSRVAVLGIGLALVILAGLDVYLLQVLQELAKVTPSTADDAVFDSELTVALYLLPALLAGVGVNVTSDVLIHHLSDAQRRFFRRFGDD